MCLPQKTLWSKFVDQNFFDNNKFSIIFWSKKLRSKKFVPKNFGSKIYLLQRGAFPLIEGRRGLFFFLLLSFTLMRNQSKLLLQPTEVELGLQFGVEFDNNNNNKTISRRRRRRSSRKRLLGKSSWFKHRKPHEENGAPKQNRRKPGGHGHNFCGSI